MGTKEKTYEYQFKEHKRAESQPSLSAWNDRGIIFHERNRPATVVAGQIDLSTGGKVLKHKTLRTKNRVGPAFRMAAQSGNRRSVCLVFCIEG